MIKAIAYLWFALALFGLCHQYCLTGKWWQWEQFWHHESLVAICLALGIGILIGGGKR